MESTILVTGGAGYIGSHTVRVLLEAGRKVVVLDNLSAGKLMAVPKGALFEKCDTRDLPELIKVFAKHRPSAVLHFAAWLAAGDSVYKPLEYYDNNVVGSIRLLTAMAQFNVKHFVFSSTSAVYGQPDHVPIIENFPFHPESPYGQTKLAVEQILPWAELAHGIKSVALRYFNAAGAHPDGTMGLDTPDPTQLIPRAITAILRHQPVEINGTDWPTPDGTCIRDYIHVCDLAEAHVKSLEHLENGGKSTAYNLGTGHGTSVKQIITAIEKVSGRQFKIKLNPRRPGDPAQSFANCDKAFRELAWKPKFTDVNDIVKTAWQWHSTHPQGYGREE